MISENVYYFTKTHNLRNIVDTINSYYEDEELTEYERNKKIREIETLNYIDIYIEGSRGLIKYTSNDKISEEVKPVSYTHLHCFQRRKIDTNIYLITFF